MTWTRWLVRSTATAVVGVMLATPALARPTAGTDSAVRSQPGSRARELAAGAVAPVGGRVLRAFDPPATPYGRGHRGVDLAAVPGEPVRSAMPGTVTFAGPVGGVAWVTVTHDGGLVTTYGGFAVEARRGDRVALGAPLGHAGERARLDWGARRYGAYIDPLGLLGGWQLRLVPVR